MKSVVCLLDKQAHNKASRFSFWCKLLLHPFLPEFQGHWTDTCPPDPQQGAAPREESLYKVPLHLWLAWQIQHLPHFFLESPLCSHFSGPHLLQRKTHLNLANMVIPPPRASDWLRSEHVTHFWPVNMKESLGIWGTAFFVIKKRFKIGVLPFTVSGLWRVMMGCLEVLQPYCDYEAVANMLKMAE